ncbi:MAG: PAS domain S-box protein [Candidatus Latescibacteria bacterium]|nr:PAS domain S-box protein [Candidatus Latescibacterota bacterium]
MDDRNKTKEQLITELKALRKRVSELEAIESEPEKKGKSHRENEKYLVLLDNTPDVVMCFDNEYRPTYVSPSINEITGMNPEDFIGKKHRELNLPEKLVEFWEERIRSVFETGKKISDQFEIDIPGGKTIFDWRLIPEFGPDGTVKSVYTTARDITKQKEALEALRISEQRYRNIFNNVPVSIWEYDFSEMLTILDGIQEKGIENFYTFFENNPDIFQQILNSIKLLEVNNHTLVMYNAPSKDGILSQYGVHHPEALKAWRKAMVAYMEGKPGVATETVNYTFDGELIYVSIHIAFTEEMKRNGRALVIAHDITERKRVEEELKSIFNLSIDMVCVADIHTATFTKINPAFTKILGFTEEELLGESFLNFIHPDDVQVTVDVVMNELRKGKEVINFENRYRCKDGSYRWLNWMSNPVPEQGLTYAVAHDITETKKIEEQLLLERDKFRKYIDLAGVILLTLDSMGNISLINTKGCEILGYQEKEIFGKNWFENFISPYSVAEIKDVFNKIISGNLAPVEYVESVVITKSGSERLILWHNALLYNDNGLIAGTLSSGEDITDRKKAEESLLRERDLNRRITKTSPSSIVMTNKKGEITFANPQAEKVLGMTKDKITQRTYNSPEWHITDFDGNPFPEEKLSFNRVMATKQSVYDIRHAVEWKNGRRVMLSVNASPLFDEKGEFEGMVATLDDITEQMNRERALRESEEKFRTIVETSPSMILITDDKANTLYASPNCIKYTGYSQDELLKNFNWWISDDDMPRMRELYERSYREKVGYRNIEYKGIKKNGDEWYASASWEPLFDNNKKFNGFIVLTSDVTEKIELQKQLLQAQKMESIGRLAGGIAHDFNNILTAIIGNSELALMSLFPGNPLYDDIHEIKIGADRAAKLTRQLLAFSRRQIIEPRISNLNNLILNMDKMLRRLIGEDLEFVILTAEDLWLINVDPGQIEQVVTNLVVNARDAMPQGGTLTIETANVTLDEEYIKNHSDTNAGDYVMLAVGDTGVGMDEETISQIFEPFFTTKETGKGTGLGLSTCYGIVKQNKGNIDVQSEPGKGSTFRIYIPRAHDMGKDKTGIILDNLPGGTETILVVEDEPRVRKMLIRILSNKGYKIIEASHGEEALLKSKDFKEKVHLLVTDVIMPRMGGEELSAKFNVLFPDMKVLFMSGYTDNTIVQNGILNPGLDFIQKPFTPAGILKKIRGVLDS